MLDIMLVASVAKEKPCFRVSGKEPKISVKAKLVAICKSLNLSILSEFQGSLKYADGLQITFEVIKIYALDVWDALFLD
jgi:hypothetical protein